MSIVSLFCQIHDFFMMYETHLSTHCLPSQTPSERRERRRSLHASEVMTLLVAFHQSNYRTLKHFYEKHVCLYWCSEFPNLVSYARFVQLQQEVLPLLTLYLYTRLGTCSGISFVDSTPLRVCDNRRISKHRVFWDGSMGLNSISSSTMPVNFCGLFSHQRILMTGSPCRSCAPQAYLAISTQIEAISQKTYAKYSASKGST